MQTAGESISRALGLLDSTMRLWADDRALMAALREIKEELRNAYKLSERGTP